MPRKYAKKTSRPRRRVMRRRGPMRARRMLNPMPTFVETYNAGQIFSNAGGVFQARITDIPQVAQYNTLYKQYRINWIKVMLVPIYSYASTDPNSALYNNANAVPYLGTARITFAINDSPATGAPANELAVLTDNGSKVQQIVNKWARAFKPVASVQVQAVGGGSVATKQKFRQWFNFDLQNVANNPEHQGISYWITQATGPGAQGAFEVYYKVSFSLRDPQ